MTKPHSEAWSKLLWWGFWTMSFGAFVLLFQGELLMMFGAIIMALVCWDEIQQVDSKSE
jgi:hypothetical protein